MEVINEVLTSYFLIVWGASGYGGDPVLTVSAENQMPEEDAENESEGEKMRF